jgi:hypothetical protein
VVSNQACGGEKDVVFVCDKQCSMYEKAETIFWGWLYKQVLEPSTLEKVHMEGENYTGKLEKYMGGREKVPSYLGGHCTCTSCKEQVCTKKESGEASTSSSSVAHRRPRSQQQQQLKQVEEGEAEKEDKGSEENPLIEPPPSFATYTAMLRTIIVGLLMFWVFVAMVAGNEPLLQSSSLPT